MEDVFLNVRRLRKLRNVPTFSLFYGFNVHFWLRRTGAGESLCTEERRWRCYSTEAQHENGLNDIQLQISLPRIACANR